MLGCARAGDIANCTSMFLVGGIPRAASICSTADTTAVANVVGSIPSESLAARLMLDEERVFMPSAFLLKLVVGLIDTGYVF